MERSNVKKNLIYNTIYQITTMILPLITAPYISRVIGAEGLGIYSYNHSIALYFVYFSMLGILNYGNRSISKCTTKEQMNKIFSSIYTFQLITSIFVFFIYVIYAYCTKNNQSIVFIMMLHISSAIFDVSWYFFGIQNFKLTSIRQIVIKLISFISIFIFVKNTSDLWVYTLIMSLSYFISAFSLWLLVWKKIEFKKSTKLEIISHIKPCLVLFIPIIATSIYRIMDKIMIGNFSNMKEVGYYENAEKLIMVSLGILGSFATVIMPKICNLLATNENKKAKEMFDKSMEFGLFLGMAICFGIASISSEFVPFFFGSEFKKSIGLSIILSTTIPLITFSTMIRNLYLIPYEKDKIYVKSVVLGAIINFFVNLIFIKKYGAYGATIGTIAAELTLVLYQVIKISKELNVKKYIKDFMMFSFFGTCMTIVIRCVALWKINVVLKIILEIICGGLSYILLTFLFFSNTKIIKKNIENIIKKETERD